MASKRAIIATIGPASENTPTFFSMIEGRLDVVRLNFSWGSLDEKSQQINLVRKAEIEFKRKIPIIADLPGPRIQHGTAHGYTPSMEAVTAKDLEHMRFGIDNKVDYFAISFVGSAKDVLYARQKIREFGGNQKIIAKIERKAALDDLSNIIKEADAVMVARGDLGEELPVEQIPFAQRDIIATANRAGKPVIVATQMMLSMTKSRMPTRAEVSDVADAVIEGADAVMLSEETANGRHPKEAIEMMERIVAEAERHLPAHKAPLPL
jgi:pyruvate kinase